MPLTSDPSNTRDMREELLESIRKLEVGIELLASDPDKVFYTRNMSFWLGRVVDEAGRYIASIIDRENASAATREKEKAR